jgi:hypothetical protein
LLFVIHSSKLKTPITIANCKLPTANYQLPKKSLTSPTFPVTAATAAVNGDANNVLARGPCLPSKFLLLVLIQYFPAGILSSFIPRQAEHPGPRN